MMLLMMCRFSIIYYFFFIWLVVLVLCADSVLLCCRVGKALRKLVDMPLLFIRVVATGVCKALLVDGKLPSWFGSVGIVHLAISFMRNCCARHLLPSLTIILDSRMLSGWFGVLSP